MKELWAGKEIKESVLPFGWGKDSKVEISMIVLWPPEDWPKFFVSYICLKGLLFRTLGKMACRGLMAGASGSLSWAGLLHMAAKVIYCTTLGSIICKTMACMLLPGVVSCRHPVQEHHISALVNVKCERCHNLMLNEPLLLA